ncbi:MAG: spondin domain-containing protein [Verrucomicrobiales bacterium]|nr:spondin domain-containing protein [Verrucomicrobiales bacterium]
MKKHSHAWASALLGLSAMSSQAATTTVRVTVENIAPANSVSFAPFRLGFGNGTFDAFNSGFAATPAIVSIAEGGSGNVWIPEFLAAEPNAVIGAVGGPETPGSVFSADFEVDGAINRYFTYAAMVVPSNDLFIGNDNPVGTQLFDEMGAFTSRTFTLQAGAIWDAGSEQAIAANAAFLVGSVNGDRVDENSTVSFEFSELAAYNGLTTAAGYVFDSSSLNANTDILRVTITSVPEPSSAVIALAGLGGLIPLLRRRRH